MPTIHIPVGQVDVEGLTLLAAGLERLTGGGKVNIRQVVEITSENMQAIWAMEDLFKQPFMKSLPGPEEPMLLTVKSKDFNDVIKASEVMAKRGRTKAVKVGAKGRMGSPGVPKVRSYQCTACAIPEHVGTKFSGHVVGLLIKSGKFPPGTRFYHPNKGKLVVSAKHELIAEEKQ